MQQVSFTYSNPNYTSPSTLKPTLETHTCSGVYTTTTERVGFGYTVRSENNALYGLPYTCYNWRNTDVEC